MNEDTTTQAIRNAKREAELSRAFNKSTPLAKIYHLEQKNRALFCEREACAQIAEAMGAPNVAAMIRAR